MATIDWKNLPTDILSIIDKLLGTDVDNLRLRSVCSTWRSSLPLPHKPITFPLKLPPLPDTRFNVESDFFLNEITFYRVDIADESLLVEVSSQTNSKAFSILNSLWIDAPIPMDLNLLDYRISEISKSHSVNTTDDDPMATLGFRIVLPLWNYLTDCEFAVLALRSDKTMLYWKLGDDDWTPIHDSVYIDYVALHQGKCYAVYDGGLACLDSDMKLKIVAAWPVIDYLDLVRTYLVECNSDLFVVFCSYRYEFFDEAVATALPVYYYGLRKFNECNGSLDSVEDLTDVFFILNDFASEGASHGFTANDFAGFQGKAVYFVDFSRRYKVNWGSMMGVSYFCEDIVSI